MLCLLVRVICLVLSRLLCIDEVICPIAQHPADNEQSLPGYSSYGGTAQAAGGGDAVATPIVFVEEEDPMEAQFESEELVETPMEQDTPIDHTYCTDSVCYGEAEPFPTMTAHETRVYFESYLGLNGLVLSDTSTMDTSDSDYVPVSRPFVPETVCRTTRQHGWTLGMYYEP
jgi:hypothetical protein